MRGCGPLTRRSVVVGALGGLLMARGVVSAEDPQTGESGLIREDWFLQSTLDLTADLGLASERGKHLAVLWEVKDSPLCAETHIKTLGDATIAAYIHTRFEIVQFDAAGAREVDRFRRHQGARKGSRRQIRRSHDADLAVLSRDGRGDGRKAAATSARSPACRAMSQPRHVLAVVPVRRREGLPDHDTARLSQGAADLSGHNFVLTWRIARRPWRRSTARPSRRGRTAPGVRPSRGEGVLDRSGSGGRTCDWSGAARPRGRRRGGAPD